MAPFRTATGPGWDGAIHCGKEAQKREENADREGETDKPYSAGNIKE